MQPDGGSLRVGQREGITARCLRPDRIVKVFVVDHGRTRELTQVAVNRFGTVRVFYRAPDRGTALISVEGAQFDGRTLRQHFPVTAT